MLRTLISFLLCILLTTPAIAQGPDWAWIKNIGDKTTRPLDITTDDDGNVYIIDGDTDTHIFKYSPQGDLLWSKNSGYPYDDYGTGITADASGNIYICGAYRGFYAANFFGYNMPVSHVDDIYVAHLDKQGNAIWVQTGGSQWDDFFRFGGITTDNAGNVLLNGNIEDTATFGNITVPTQATDPFTAKYDSNGNLLWIKTFGSKKEDGGFNIAADASGNIYSTGFFKDTAHFGNYTFVCPSTAYSAMYLLKQNSNGDVVWAKNFDSADNPNAGFNLAVTPAGEIYLTGDFWGYIRSGQFSFNNLSNQSHAFIVKYAPDGTALWADTINQPSIYQTDVTLGFNGDVYVSCDGVIATKYNSNGQRQWQPGIRAEGPSLTTDKFGNIYATGACFKTTFNGTALLEGAYLAKLRPFPLSVNTTEKENTLTIYPNPAQDIIHVFSPVADAYTITGINGISVLSGRLKKGDNSISVDNIPGGTYIIYTGNGYNTTLVKLAK